jgi:hypothetical protein
VEKKMMCFQLLRQSAKQLNNLYLYFCLNNLQNEITKL